MGSYGKEELGPTINGGSAAKDIIVEREHGSATADQGEGVCEESAAIRVADGEVSVEDGGAAAIA